MKQAKAICAVISLMLLAGISPAQDGKVAVLLVTNDEWNAGDTEVQAKFDSLGFDVFPANHNDVTADYADGMDFVYISSTVSSGQVTNKFKDVEIPVILIEPYAQDDMGMTLDTDSTRFFQAVQGNMIVEAEGHFLAAGLTGEVEVFTVLEIQSGQGIPGGEGILIASYVPADGEWINTGAIYAYEKGALMADSTAAAGRRYFAGWNDEGVANLTEDGWKIWQASIDWALYKDQGTAVRPENGRMPGTHLLFQNFPNPFNASTAVTFFLPSRSRVRVDVTDVRGKLTAVLIDGEREAGNHRVAFYASGLASGLYFCTLTAGELRVTRKMTLIR